MSLDARISTNLPKQSPDQGPKLARAIQYARSYQIHPLIKKGWSVGSFYGERGGFDCYLMEWHHDHEPSQDNDCEGCDFR